MILLPTTRGEHAPPGKTSGVGGIVLGLVLCLAITAGTARAGEPQLPGAQPTDRQQRLAERDRQQRLAERDRLWEQTRKLRGAGRLSQAVAAAEKMLAIERQLFGNVHSETVTSVRWLARLHAEREDFTAARQARQDVLELETKLHGGGDWRVTDARLALAEVDRLARLAPEPRRLLAEADRLNQRGVDLDGQGKSEAALEPARRALEIRKQVLGERHPHYALSLNNLAGLYESMGDYARAEPLYR